MVIVVASRIFGVFPLRLVRTEAEIFSRFFLLGLIMYKSLFEVGIFFFFTRLVLAYT